MARINDTIEEIFELPINTHNQDELELNQPSNGEVAHNGQQETYGIGLVDTDPLTLELDALKRELQAGSEPVINSTTSPSNTLRFTKLDLTKQRMLEKCLRPRRMIEGIVDEFFAEIRDPVERLADHIEWLNEVIASPPAVIVVSTNQGILAEDTTAYIGTDANRSLRTRERECTISAVTRLIADIYDEHKFLPIIIVSGGDKYLPPQAHGDGYHGLTESILYKGGLYSGLSSAGVPEHLIDQAILTEYDILPIYTSSANKLSVLEQQMMELTTAAREEYTSEFKALDGVYLDTDLTAFLANLSFSNPTAELADLENFIRLAQENLVNANANLKNARIQYGTDSLGQSSRQALQQFEDAKARAENILAGRQRTQINLIGVYAKYEIARYNLAQARTHAEKLLETKINTVTEELGVVYTFLKNLKAHAKHTPVLNSSFAHRVMIVAPLNQLPALRHVASTYGFKSTDYLCTESIHLHEGVDANSLNELLTLYLRNENAARVNTYVLSVARVWAKLAKLVGVGKTRYELLDEAVSEITSHPWFTARANEYIMTSLQLPGPDVSAVFNHSEAEHANTSTSKGVWQRFKERVAGILTPINKTTAQSSISTVVSMHELSHTDNTNGAHPQAHQKKN